MQNRPLLMITVLLASPALMAPSACTPEPWRRWPPPVVVAPPAPDRPPVKIRAAPEGRACRDWSDVRGGPLRRGRSFCPGLRRQPVVRWQFDTGAAVIAAPIALGQWVYVGSTNGRLFALHRRTGKPRWTFEAGSPIRAAVALQGRTLLLGTADGQLRCLDAHTGHVRWTYQSNHRIDQPPVVYGHTALVSTGDGTLTALDTRTGVYRWQFVTASAWHPSQKGGYTLAGIGGPPARAGDTIYFGSLGGQVHALIAANGQLRWGIQTGWAVRSAPVVTPKGLWVSDASGYLHGLSQVNGARTQGIHSWYDKDISAPALGDGILYLATRSALLALTPSGLVRWRHKLPWGLSKLPRDEHPAPVLAGQVVYLNDRFGRLWAVDAKTGRLLWQRLAARGAFSAPAPLPEGLLVGSGDGRVYLLAAKAPNR
jgi:outer membrane protein assembly factor BamB